MNRNKQLSLMTFLLCITVGGAMFMMSSQEPEYELPVLPVELNLSTHPVYSTYRFSPEKDVVRIGIQPFWVYGANIAEAMRHDRLLAQELKSYGLRAEFYYFLKGPDINFFMNKDQLDVGMSGYLPTLKMTTLKDILVSSSIDRNFYDIIASNRLTIRELEGKKIGFPQGSDSHHALIEALELIGIKARLIPMDIDTIPRAMRNGQIDACISWEPTTSQILSENSNAHVVYRSLWVSFLYFHGEFAKAHRRVVLSLLAAQARAIRWINVDPDNMTLSSRWAIEACQLLSPDTPLFSLTDFVKLSHRAAALSSNALIFDADLEDGLFLHNAFTFMQKQGMISADADWQSTRAMFDRQKMQRIIEEPGEWRLDITDYEIQERQP